MGGKPKTNLKRDAPVRESAQSGAFHCVPAACAEHLAIHNWRRPEPPGAFAERFVACRAGAHVTDGPSVAAKCTDVAVQCED